MFAGLPRLIHGAVVCDLVVMYAAVVSKLRINLIAVNREVRGKLPATRTVFCQSGLRLLLYGVVASSRGAVFQFPGWHCGRRLFVLGHKSIDGPLKCYCNSISRRPGLMDLEVIYLQFPFVPGGSSTSSLRPIRVFVGYGGHD